MANQYLASPAGRHRVRPGRPRDARGLAPRGPAARGDARLARGRARVDGAREGARRAPPPRRRRPRPPPRRAAAPACAARPRRALRAPAARATAPRDACPRCACPPSTARRPRRRRAPRSPTPGASRAWPASRSLVLGLVGIAVVVAVLAGLWAVLRPYVAKRRAIAAVQRYALRRPPGRGPRPGLVVELPAGWVALRADNPFVTRPGARLRLAQPAVRGLRRRRGRGAPAPDGRPRRPPRRAPPGARCRACPRRRRAGAADVQLGRGRGRLVRTTWEDGLVPMQGATVAWADGYDLFSLEAWAPAVGGRRLRGRARTRCAGGSPPTGPGRGAHRRGRRAPGGGGAGTFPGRAASSRGRAHEPGPRPGGRAVRRPPDGEPRARRARRPRRRPRCGPSTSRSGRRCPRRERVRLAVLMNEIKAGRPVRRRGRPRPCAPRSRRASSPCRRSSGRGCRSCRAAPCASRCSCHDPRDPRRPLRPRREVARAVRGPRHPLPREPAQGGAARPHRELLAVAARPLHPRRHARGPAPSCCSTRRTRPSASSPARWTWPTSPALPWYERHPRSLWRFFLAVAFRLSPWRRVLFAASAIALGVGWIGLPRPPR